MEDDNQNPIDSFYQISSMPITCAPQHHDMIVQRFWAWLMMPAKLDVEDQFSERVTPWTSAKLARKAK